MDNLVGQKKYMIKVRLYLPFVREEKQETYIDKDEFIATTPGLFMVFCFMAFVFYCGRKLCCWYSPSISRQDSGNRTFYD